MYKLKAKRKEPSLVICIRRDKKGHLVNKQKKKIRV